MLLILSDDTDNSTNHVIDWLNYFGINHIRINGSSKIILNDIVVSDEEVSWNITVHENINNDDHSVSSKNINSFWYRRGELSLTKPLTTPAQVSYANFRIAKEVNSCVFDNQLDVIHFLYYNLRHTKSIGSWYQNDTVKLINLQIAGQIGLSIPLTTIVTNKESLQDFFQKHKKCITKGIKYNGIYLKDVLSGGCNTVLITDELINKMETTFAPSLLQKYYDKLFELRVFYFDNKCYSSAIFSQQDEQTKIDFRNYNDEHPNRIVPYQLPLDVEKKLVKFMNEINMQSGSIDLIVTPELDYVFLEVNPVGQYSWISASCNFQLDKVIASYFKN